MNAEDAYLESDITVLMQAWIRRGQQLHLEIQPTLDDQLLGIEIQERIQAMLLDAPVRRYRSTMPSY